MDAKKTKELGTTKSRGKKGTSSSERRGQESRVSGTIADQDPSAKKIPTEPGGPSTSLPQHAKTGAINKDIKGKPGRGAAKKAPSTSKAQELAMAQTTPAAEKTSPKRAPSNEQDLLNHEYLDRSSPQDAQQPATKHSPQEQRKDRLKRKGPKSSALGKDGSKENEPTAAKKPSTEPKAPREKGIDFRYDQKERKYGKERKAAEASKSVSPPPLTYSIDEPAMEPTSPRLTTRMSPRTKMLSDQIDLMNQNLRPEIPALGGERRPKGKSSEDQRRAERSSLHRQKEQKQSALIEDSASRSATVRITLLTVILLAVAAVGAFFFYRHYKTQLEEQKMILCRTTECKRIQQELDGMLDTKIHPCDDFYGYVCNKWVEGRTPKASGVQAYLFDIYDSALTAALRAPESRKADRLGLHIMARLFEVCYDYMNNGDGSFADAVTRVIDLLKFHNVLNKAQDIFPYLVETTLTKNFHSVFQFTFRQKGKLKYLRVDPGSSIRSKVFGTVTPILPDASNVNMFHEEMRNMTACLLNDPRINSSVDPDAILSIDYAIHLLLTVKGSEREITFEEMATYASHNVTQQVIDIINNNAPPDYNVDFSSSLRVAGLDNMLSIQYLLAQQEWEVRALYHIVSLATDLLVYITFKAAAKKNPDLVPFMCLRATRISVTNTWQLLAANITGHLKSGAATQVFAMHIRDMVLDERALEQFDALQRERGKELLRDTFLITYDATVLKFLDESTDYTSWKLEGNHLFDVLVEAGEKERYMLRKTLFAERRMAASRSQLRKLLKFHEQEKALTVPSAYQSSPLFYHEEQSEIPHYINVGSLGALIAKEMVRALVVPFKLSNRSSQTLHKSLSCVNYVAGMQGLDLFKSVTEDEIWDSEAVLWYYASLILYEGLKRYVTNAGKSASEEVWNETLHYYFIRFCTLACTSGGTAMGPPDSFKERCLVPVLSNPDFAKHFGCTGRESFKVHPCIYRKEQTLVTIR
ncbi:uncharacterized protein LOC135366024 [Ornithodoros turicata]|uniref:uncharacterized protein LOC135366024 n=1 Tax=Ornithodoros turicata TaxID=34597 RepID=UPI003138B561